MKFALGSASSAAIIVSLFGGAAWAQDSTGPGAARRPRSTRSSRPSQADSETSTRPRRRDRHAGGWRVRGRPAAGRDLQTWKTSTNQGVPTAAEFLRSLSISSEAQGEADSAIAGAAAGFANVNLRGLGASRTLVLLNGRRFASSDGGAGADINTLPMMAVGRIDVLKDGASVTYGAGAVGGVDQLHHPQGRRRLRGFGQQEVLRRLQRRRFARSRSGARKATRATSCSAHRGASATT